MVETVTFPGRGIPSDGGTGGFGIVYDVRDCQLGVGDGNGLQELEGLKDFAGIANFVQEKRIVGIGELSKQDGASGVCVAVHNAIGKIAGLDEFVVVVKIDRSRFFVKGDGRMVPDVVVIGTNANPVIAGTPTVILGGTTITLGTTGLSLNAVIADINDAAITGLVASKDISDNLVLTYTATAAATWSFTIGAGTANGALGLSDGTFDAPDPSSTSYFSAWQGNVDDEAKRDQMNEVKKYFTNLGYTTERVTNTLTGRTFKWQITW